MKSGKKLIVFLFSIAVLCACEPEMEESKSEDSIVMDIATAAVKEESFSAAIWDDKARKVDLEIADSENANEIKKEINKRLQIQGIMSYKVNISQRNKEIVNAEHRWELVLDRYLMTYSERMDMKGLGFSK